MTPEILKDNDAATMGPLYYAVVVNGQVQSKFSEKVIAESAIMNLPEDQRSAATVVAMTGDGKQLLLG